MGKNIRKARTYKEAIIENLDKVKESQEDLIPMCVPLLIANLFEIFSVYENVYNFKSDSISTALNIPRQVMTVRLWKFLSWLMDQKVEEEMRESGALWYDKEVIAELWDEFIVNVYNGV